MAFGNEENERIGQARDQGYAEGLRVGRLEVRREIPAWTSQVESVGKAEGRLEIIEELRTWRDSRVEGITGIAPAACGERYGMDVLAAELDEMEARGRRPGPEDFPIDGEAAAVAVSRMTDREIEAAHRDTKSWEARSIEERAEIRMRRLTMPHPRVGE